jgi:hypothetical protein
MVRLFWTTSVALLVLSLQVASAATEDQSAAYRALVAAYRGNPSPQQLLKLAQQARSEGRQLEARDLARRALADPTASFTPEDKAQVEAMDGRALPRYGELLVQGNHGAFVTIDGRLRGVLPLLLPLTVEPGRREVLLEFRSRRWHTQVEVPEGRMVEARFAPDTDAVAITTPPAILLLTRTTPLPALPAEALRIIDQSLRRANLARATVTDHEPLGGAGCLDTLSCPLRLGVREKVEFVLTLRLDTTGVEQRASYQLIDVAVAEVSTQAEVRCTSCNLRTLLGDLGESMNQKLLEGSTRARGELSVTSTPPGAEVRRGEISLGVTPLLRPAFAGATDIELRLAGYGTTRLSVEVREGQTVTAAATLVRDPMRRVAVRPRWRLGVGGAAATMGSFMLGVGIAALAINGRCVDAPVPPSTTCDRSFATLAPGVGLTITGPLLIAGGALLIALPPR